MNYTQLQHTVQTACMEYPNVETFGCGDIYLLSSTTPVYSVMWLSLVSRSDYEMVTTYNVNLFYVDRLVKDLSNEEQIISEGMEALETVIATLKRDPGVLWSDSVKVTFTPFRERFSDECAGVYANLSIPTVQEELCQ